MPTDKKPYHANSAFNFLVKTGRLKRIPQTPSQKSRALRMLTRRLRLAGEKQTNAEPE